MRSVDSPIKYRVGAEWAIDEVKLFFLIFLSLYRTIAVTASFNMILFGEMEK